MSLNANGGQTHREVTSPSGRPWAPIRTWLKTCKARRAAFVLRVAQTSYRVAV